MKTLAYLDCVTGIAGDMCLGALVHAGVPLDFLKEQLDKLEISHEFSLRAEIVRRNGQAATRVFVDLADHHTNDRVQELNHKHDHSHRHSHDHPHSHSHDHLHSHSHSHLHSSDRPGESPHRQDGHSDSPHVGQPVGQHAGRRLPEIEALIEGADLPPQASRWSLAVFRRLAQAEAAVHGIPPEQVHFHEVGATDALVDIVGTCLGLDWLGIDALVCSALPTGGGTVRCEHGLLPVPAPAVLRLMASAQIPVYSNGIERELVTPTGCAIAATLASSFGPPPQFVLKNIGLGAGGRELALPNILRLWIGTVDELPAAVGAANLEAIGLKRTELKETGLKETGRKDASSDAALKRLESGVQPNVETIAKTPEKVVVLQTQIDDLSPQVVGYVFDLLFEAGAVDVFAQSVLMKKNRPGTMLTVICPEAVASECERLLFIETTTLGIRRTEQRRSVLDRELLSVETDYGPVAVKVGRLAGVVANVQPEFEDCAEQARSHCVSLQQVQRAAIAAAEYLWH